MTVPRPLALAGALALAATAAANETYFTVGVANGSFEAAAPGGCTLNETSADGFGGGLGVGYRFNDPFAIEFGYQTLGSLDLDGVCGIAGTPFTLSAPDSGLVAAGVGRARLGAGWALLGRAGLYSWSSAGDSGTETVLGVGAEYEWRKGMAVRLEYTTFGSDIDAVGLALRFGF